MAVASACPYMRLLTKDAGGILTRNFNALSKMCPHLTATGVPPQAVMARIESSASTTTTTSPAVPGCTGGSLSSPCTG